MAQPGFQAYYTEPSKDTIDSIVLSSQGDIRSAVINLHFASQKSKNFCSEYLVPGISWIFSSSFSDSSKLKTESMYQSAAGKSKKAKTSKSKLKSLGTDENITVLHALGRVMNPKCKLTKKTKSIILKYQKSI